MEGLLIFAATWVGLVLLWRLLLAPLLSQSPRATRSSACCGWWCERWCA